MSPEAAALLALVIAKGDGFPPLTPLERLLREHSAEELEALGRFGKLPSRADLDAVCKRVAAQSSGS